MREAPAWKLEHTLCLTRRSHLKCAGGGVGLLLNFGKRAEFKRFVVGDPKNSLPLLRPRIEAARGAEIRPVAV